MVRLETSRLILRIVLAAAYLAAGIAHLRSPAPFLSITPDWVPWPELVIAATGVAEILGATALVAIPRLRRAAAIAPDAANRAMAQKSSTMMTVCSWLMLILCHVRPLASKQRP